MYVSFQPLCLSHSFVGAIVIYLYFWNAPHLALQFFTDQAPERDQSQVSRRSESDILLVHLHVL